MNLCLKRSFPLARNSGRATITGVGVAHVAQQIVIAVWAPVWLSPLPLRARRLARPVYKASIVHGWSSRDGRNAVSLSEKKERNGASRSLRNSCHRTRPLCQERGLGRTSAIVEYHSLPPVQCLSRPPTLKGCSVEHRHTSGEAVGVSSLHHGQGQASVCQGIWQTRFPDPD